MYDEIAIAKVQPAKDNIRRKLGDVRDLVASVRSVGIVEPLLVTPPADGDDMYTVVAGHRRLAAAEAAGLDLVPCTIRQLSDMERVEIMLIENLARSDLSIIEEASGYFRMVEFGLTAKELGARVGRSATHIKARLALLELPAAARSRVDSGSITIADATALLRLRDHPDSLDRLLKSACEGGWGHGAIERQVVCELRRIESEAKVDAARADLLERGMPLVETWDRWRQRRGDPVAVGDGSDELHVDAKRHAKEPCHGAHVTAHGEVVALCREPARHRAGGGSKVQAPAEDKPTRSEGNAGVDRAAARERREHERQRRTFCSELLGRRLRRTDVQALIANQWIAGVGVNLARSACELLDIAAVETDYGYQSFPAAIAAYAAQGTPQRDRACFALALAAGDDATRWSNGPATATHLAFLASYGWQESEPAAAPSDDYAGEPATAA